MMAVTTKPASETKDDSAAVKADPDLRAEVVALAKGRPIIDSRSMPGKGSVEICAPTLAEFMARGIQLGAKAFYISAKPVRKCLSVPSSRNLAWLQYFMMLVDHVDRLEFGNGKPRSNPASAFAAELRTRYPRKSGDPMEGECVGRSYSMDAPGAHAVSFAAQGIVHVFYLQCRATMQVVIDQLWNDIVTMYEVQAGLTERVLRRMGQIATELDSIPEFTVLDEVEARCKYIKHRYGTTLSFAITIEEIWYHSCTSLDQKAEPAAKQTLLE